MVKSSLTVLTSLEVKKEEEAETKPTEGTSPRSKEPESEPEDWTDMVLVKTEMETADEEPQQEAKKPAVKKPVAARGKYKMTPHTCDLCQRVFPSYNRMKQHIEVSHLKVRLPCERCGRQLIGRDALKVHIKFVHEKKDQKEKCDQCGRLVKNMTVHKRTNHDPTNTRVCSICGRSFVNRIVYNAHLRRVHGPPRYQCQFCNKLFKQKKSLDQHTAAHTGKVLNQCKLCDFQTNYRHNFVIHMKKNHEREYLEERREFIEKHYDLASMKTNHPAYLLPNLGDSKNF